MKNRATILARIASRRLTVLPELHRELLERLRPLLTELGGRLTPWEGYRDAAKQQDAFDRGTSAARPGESPHNFRPALACDLVLNPALVPVRAHPDDPESPWLWDDETPEALAAWEALEVAAVKYGLERVSVRGVRDRPHVQLFGWRALIPH